MNREEDRCTKGTVEWHSGEYKCPPERPPARWANAKKLYYQLTTILGPEYARTSIAVIAVYVVEPNRYAEQLYEDLLYYYNKNVRPVKNASESIKVKFGASLIRIIDVDEVNQVLTTNLWLEMQWFDYKLSWDPARWGGIKKLHIPSDQIWIPDILLYNK
ncbi:hypothetical protein DICVIV_07857 [Dictyocaulus viviparus]|uniref:Neurotransmitter-gated ion-channel ligand-binding domain-containing protein n=1 Tax=Dictyocaulus viviparus TaxID=29172 RepID=A0A0D8XQP7_DICVI|nr:hypothetical protein DICVIV_07857 [Dictyocaulus viviparus]